jgi:hypothetical protein
MRLSIAMTLLAILVLLPAACSNEHSGKEIESFSGDYRIYAGIAEFFDCKQEVKYYVSKKGAYEELAEQYAALAVAQKEDVYIKVEGYLEEEEMMEGIDPMTVFVAARFISADPTRGCERGRRVGH